MRLNGTGKLVSKRVIFSLGCGVILAATAQQSMAGLLDELSPASQDRLNNGELVAVYEQPSVPGAPWPVCKVYKKVKATAEEAAAVFSDYGIQSTYVPGIVKSDVIKCEPANQCEISYTIKLSFGPISVKEDYTAVDTVSADGQGGYVVSWDVIPSSSIKQSVGSARFENFGDEAIISYTSFVYPNKFGAKMVVEQAKKQVNDGVNALVNQIESEKADQPELLHQQVEAMKKALNP